MIQKNVFEDFYVYQLCRFPDDEANELQWGYVKYVGVKYVNIPDAEAIIEDAIDR